MSERTAVVDVAEIPDGGGHVFTVAERDGSLQEVFVVTTDDGDVRAWQNFCQHETDQRLYREGVGVIMRDCSIICPKHGSTFDCESGYCDNGDAKGSTLVGVDVTVADGTVYLDDPTLDYLYDGPRQDEDGDDDDDGMPSSTSHIRF
jgi:nitrite reductase/ring-hydroxylating ferredoxin subunit